MNSSSESAVIVLLEEASDSIILTQRSAHLRDHPGEVCFPGGRWHAEDANLWMTALRELHEELGIGPDRVQCIKKLQLERTLRGITIHPWLATIPSFNPYLANEHEVAAVFTLAMREVKQLTNYKDIEIEHLGKKVITCQFKASDYFVWGATARIMKQLCEM